jgi:hypothetical protein
MSHQSNMLQAWIQGAQAASVPLICKKIFEMTVKLLKFEKIDCEF